MTDLDALLDALADRVAERVIARIEASEPPLPERDPSLEPPDMSAVAPWLREPPARVEPLSTAVNGTPLTQPPARVAEPRPYDDPSRDTESELQPVRVHCARCHTPLFAESYQTIRNRNYCPDCARRALLCRRCGQNPVTGDRALCHDCYRAVSAPSDEDRLVIEQAVPPQVISSGFNPQLITPGSRAQ